MSGCDTAGYLLRRATDSDQAYYLPLTIEIRFDPSVMQAAVSYTDACQQVRSLPIGDELQKAFKKEMGLAFEKVRIGSGTPGAASSAGTDGAVDIAVGLGELQLHITRQGARTYPATMTLGGTAVLVDRSGTVLHGKALKTELSQSVMTEDKGCDVGGLHELAEATADKLAKGFKEQFGTSPKVRELAQHPAPRPAATAARPTLSFRAMVSDQNRDQAVVAGEEITIQAEVSNDGSVPARDVMLGLGGSPALIAQFAQPVSVGMVMPGESKPVQLRGTAPALTAPQDVELVMTVSAAGEPGVEKRLRFRLEPGRAHADVDAPGTFASRARQNAAAIAIGIGAYRDASVGALQAADVDAELVARYFTEALGVPSERVRLLKNESGLKADFVEAIEQWLPTQVKTGGAVFIYVAAYAQQTDGVLSWLPHEAAQGKAISAYSLRRFYDALATVPAQRIVIVSDVALTSTSGVSAAAWSVPPALREKAVHIVRVGSGTDATRGMADTAKHGRLTTAVLSGIRGGADVNGDRVVTLGELCAYVPTQDSDARCVPTVGEKDKAAAFPLVRLKADSP